MTFREFIDRGLDTPIEVWGEAVLIVLGLAAAAGLIFILVTVSFWAYKRRRYDRVRRRSQPRIRL